MTTQFTPEILAEIFKYHPPTTEERKRKHEAVNLATMEFAKACVPGAPEDQKGLISSKEACLEILTGLVQSSVFLARAGRELDSACLYARDGHTTEAVMCVQVARMLINQAITYESLGISI